MATPEELDQAFGQGGSSQGTSTTAELDQAFGSQPQEDEPILAGLKKYVQQQPEQDQREQVLAAQTGRPLVQGDKGVFAKSQTDEELAVEEQQRIDAKKQELKQLPLKGKIEYRRAYRDMFSKQWDSANKPLGQDNPIAKDMAVETAVHSAIPLNEQEKQTEQNYNKIVDEERDKNKKVQLERLHERYKGFGGAPEGMPQDAWENVLVANEMRQQEERGLLSTAGRRAGRIIVGGVGDTLSTLVHAGAGLDAVVGKITGRPMQEQIAKEHKLADILESPGRIYDYYIPPTPGEEKGNISSQIAGFFGDIAGLGGLTKATASVLGKDAAKHIATAVLAGMGGKGAGQFISREETMKHILEGMDPLAAKALGDQKGDIASLLTLPVSAAAARYSPVMGMLGEKTILAPWPMKALVGASGAAVENMAQQAWIEGLPYIPKVFDIKEFNKENLGQSMASVGEAGLVAFLAGGPVSVLLAPKLSPEQKQAIMDYQGRWPDSSDKHELLRTFMEEGKLPRKQAVAAVNFFDNAVEAMVREQKVEDTQAAKVGLYLQLIANRSQRNLPGMIQMQQAGRSAELVSALREKVQSDKFKQSFGEGGDPEQILSWLKNQPGVKQDEIQWTETDQFLREQKERGGKVGQEELLKHLDEFGVRVETLIKNKPGAQFPAEERPDYSSIRPSGPSTKYEEWLLKVPKLQDPVYSNKVRKVTADDGTKLSRDIEYRPSHFGPEARNTIVHVRLDERIINDKPTLMIHEVQSDWHQEGRESGYQGQEPPSARNKQGLAAGFADTRPPLGPFSKSWLQLAWKKILLEASTRGYEQVAWAPGELQDKFQADPGEEARKGRTKFYNEITPQVVKELLKKKGWEGKVEVGEVDIARPEVLRAGVDTETAGIAQLANHWVIIDNNRNTMPFATRQEAEGHLLAMKQEHLRIKEPVFTISLPEQTRQRIQQDGFPLFQKEGPSEVKSSEYLKPGEELKAILLKDGSVVVGRGYDKHLDMIVGHSIDPDQIKGTGIVKKAGSKVLFQGDNTYNSFYKASIEGGKPIELPKESFDALDVTDTKTQALPPTITKRDSVMNFFRNQELFQGAKASVEFLDTMQAIIRGLNNPDASSAVHELGHIIAQTMLPEKYQSILDKFVGAKPGEPWHLEAHEKFARAMEQYVLENRPPSSDLAGTFNILSEQIKGIYKSIEGGPLGEYIPETIRQAFDNIFLRDRGIIEEARKPVLDAETKMEILKGEMGKEPSPGQLMEMEQLKKEQAVAVEKLQREQQLNFNPHEMTRVEKHVAERDRIMSMIQPAEDDNYFNLSQTVSRSVHYLGELVTRSSTINRSPLGRLFLERLGPYFANQRAEAGKYAADWMMLRKAISKEGHNTLSGLSDGQGFIRRFFEGKLTDKEKIDPDVRSFLNLFARVQGELDGVTELTDTFRTLPSGDLVKFTRGLGVHVPRMPTSDGYHIINDRSNPLHRALVADLMAKNKGLSEDVIDRELKYHAMQAITRPFGMLEFSRTIENWPDVLNFHGREITLFHYKPHELLTRMVLRTTNKQAFTTMLGGGRLKNVAAGSEGYSGRLVSLAKIFDIPITRTPEQMKDFLVNQGHVEDRAELDKLDRKGLQALAKELGVSSRLPAQDLLNKIMKKISGDVKNNEREKQLRTMANQIGGIDSRGDIADVWNEMKRRISTQVEDDLLLTWKNAIVEEDGNSNGFDRLVRAIQGVPNFDLDMTGDLTTRALVAGFDIFGSAVTTTSFWKNLPQALKIGIVSSWNNVAHGFDDVLTKYDDMEFNAVFHGAAEDVRFLYRPESTFALEKIGSYVKQGIGTFFGMGPVTQGLNVLAYSVARRQAFQWKEGGFKKQEAPFARVLGLSEESVQKLIDTKGVGMDDTMFRQIVQEVGNKSQYVLENPHKKGALETNPVTRRLVAFNAYRLGNMRFLGSLMDTTQRTLATKDPKQILGLGILWSKFFAVALGGEFVTQAIYGKIKGAPARPDDDKWWLRVLGAAFESNMIGIPYGTLDPNAKDQGYEHWFMSNIPIVSTAASFFTTLVGTSGKTQDLPLWERSKAAGRTVMPAVGALMNWWEKENNLPRFQAQEVRNQVTAWKKTQPGFKDQAYTSQPLNPDYWPVYEAVSRFDLEDSVIAFQEYMRAEISNGTMAKDAAQGLRASLLARRPVNLAWENGNLGKFYTSLKPEDRQRAMMLNQRYMYIVNRILPVIPE